MPRDEQQQPEVDLGQVGKLYQTQNGWLYRLTVRRQYFTDDSIEVPAALPQLLNVLPGESGRRRSSQGSPRFRWDGETPFIDGIRRSFLASGVSTGCQAFLGLQGTLLTVEPVTIPAGDSLTRALALIGATDMSARRDARLRLARAIGLPVLATAPQIIDAYRELGDDDVAELLLDAGKAFQ